MRKSLRILLAAAVVFASAGPLRAADAATEAAEAAAAKWLATVDAGKYGESWDSAAAAFRQALTRAKWEEALRQVRAPLGSAASRKKMGANYTKELPGAPAGEYVVIQFATDFANRSGATETVTPMKESDGTWRVSGYYIK